MKRLLLIGAVLTVVLLASAPGEAEAACGRFRSRVRSVATAPFRLIRAVRHLHCDCGPACNCRTSAGSYATR